MMAWPSMVPPRRYRASFKLSDLSTHTSPLALGALSRSATRSPSLRRSHRAIAPVSTRSLSILCVAEQGTRTKADGIVTRRQLEHARCPREAIRTSKPRPCCCLVALHSRCRCCCLGLVPSPPLVVLALLLLVVLFLAVALLLIGIAEPFDSERHTQAVEVIKQVPRRLRACVRVARLSHAQLEAQRRRRERMP